MAAQIIFAVFAILGVFHIAFIVLRKERAKRISKCLIVPLLLAAYIAAGGSKYPLVIAALILGWFGDVLLIRIDKKYHFILGLASFLLGHLCYIIAFTGVLGFGGGANINISAIAIFTPPAAALGFVVFRLVKPSREMYVPVIAYMGVIMGMTLFGFQVFLFNQSIAGLLILSGCLCFMISDTLLAYYTFRKPKISGSVFIMSYYILAQAEIIIGLLLL